jgi:ribosomal protein S1
LGHYFVWQQRSFLNRIQFHLIDIVIFNNANRTNDEHFVIGQEVEALVIQADRNTWNLVLSIRILKEKQLRDDFEKFMESEQEDQSKTTIGDLFEETLKKRK